MRFALIDDKRVEAMPKLKGLCPGCSQPVTAKCGTRRIWHWAHLTKKTCDRWWEPETEWHRLWKNNFPIEWQENIQHDNQSGEKHIADVRTNHGLVIEFQHSHLDPQERIARESFYKNMIWVIDGTRLKRDYPRFIKGKELSGRIIVGQPFLVHFPEECFPSAWLASSVPVIFDFRGVTTTDPPDEMRELIWWLLPNRAGRNAVAQAMSRTDFVQIVSNHQNILQEAHRIINDFEVRIQKQRVQQELMRLGNSQRFIRRPRGRRYARL